MQTTGPPADLRQALQEAEEALDASETGDLSLPHRRRVWAALGEGTEGYGSPGHRRRTTLDLITVEHVKPIWEVTYPSDPSVDDVLDGARQVLEGRQSAQWAHDLKGRAWTEFINRMGADHEFPAGHVGTAACAALFTAAQDKTYADLPPDTDDYDLDVDEWDTSFMAAMAAAGDEEADPAGSKGRTREFWHWYLREAVPAAWGAGE